jgi:hypothetical protein
VIDSPATSELYGLSPAQNAALEGPSIEDLAKRIMRDNVARLMADSHFLRAAEALVKFRSGAFKDLPFVELQALLASLSVRRKRRPRRETFALLWAAGTGKTWKALKDFPGRLRGIADEVERVNAGPCFDLASWINKETIGAQMFRHRLLQLPGLLRVYAASLEFIVGKLPAMTERIYPAAPRGHSEFMFLLSAAVKLTTGRFRDKEVAEMLNAAALALGEGSQFDALTLAQARFRRRAAGVKT